jgi:GTP-binding nuclear protein Ran
MSSQNVKTFKILLLGSASVGKTSFINRLLGKCFKHSYNPTLGVEVNPLRFSYSNDKGEKGTIIFNVWDCAGQERYKGLGDGYYIQSDAAIFMFDGSETHMPYDSNNDSLSNLVEYSISLDRISKSIPSVIVANKCESSAMDSRYNTLACSAKSMKNIYSPFIILAQKLMNDSSIKISQYTSGIAYEPIAMGTSCSSHEYDSSLHKKEIMSKYDERKKKFDSKKDADVLNDIVNQIDIVVKPKSKIRKENEDETLTLHNPLVYDDWYEPSDITVHRTTHVPSEITKYDEEIEALKNKINDLTIFKESIPRILDDLEQDILNEVETRFQ